MSDDPKASAAVPFLASLVPSERARAAGAPVEVDLGPVKPAELYTVEWRGRPVWILKRTPDMLKRLLTAEPYPSDPNSEVSSQQPPYAHNATRSIEPEVLVTVALCTHLGCIPSYYPEPDSLQPGWPAPTNLVIPPHRYLSPQRLPVGGDEA